MKVEERIFPNLTSPYDIRDYKLAAKITTTEFPETFELDSVTVKDQGNVGSCVAHACSSIVEYHNNRQQKAKDTFSTEFIYGYRPESENYYVGEGMYVREALKTLKDIGDCRTSELKGNHKVEEAMKIVNEKLEDLKPLAEPHKISSYIRLTSIDDIKTALMDYGYVIFAMRWHKDYKLKNGIYTYTTEEIRGSHAMVIYGWNKDGWLVHNSWGKSWGRSGKFILPFDLKLSEAWAVCDTNTFKDEDIVKPEEENIFIKWFSGIINKIVNFFNKIFKKII